MARKSTYHHGDLRETLVDLATAAVEQNGADAVSVRALARDAGVAHRAAYQHFPDKNGLLAAVLARAYDRLETRFLAALDETAPPDARLNAIAVAYAAFAVDEPNMFLAMTGPRINQANAYPELERGIRRNWRLVTRAIADGVDSGLFDLDDQHAAAAIYWGGLQGVLTQAALGRLKLAKKERDAFFRIVAKRLVDSLKPRLSQPQHGYGVSRH